MVKVEERRISRGMWAHARPTRLWTFSLINEKTPVQKLHACSSFIFILICLSVPREREMHCMFSVFTDKLFFSPLFQCTHSLKTGSNWGVPLFIGL